MKYLLTIDRFEEDKAILKTEDNKTIVWPKQKLPSDIKEGAVLTFIITKDLETEDEKKELAKNILNEILNVNEG